VNDLLHRKSSWGDGDVLRFTELVRQDHLHEQEELRAKVELGELERKVEEGFEGLMRAILNRFVFLPSFSPFSISFPLSLFVPSPLLSHISQPFEP
jgi:hypothetical protein